jgi:hypothetical protein
MTIERREEKETDLSFRLGAARYAEHQPAGCPTGGTRSWRTGSGSSWALTVDKTEGGRIQLWERPAPAHRIHGIASCCIPQDTLASCERFARQTSTPDGSADCEIGKPGPGF